MSVINLNEIFDLENIFDTYPDLLCLAGYDGYFKKINPAVSKTLGYTENELFAKPIDSFVYADDRAVTSRKRQNLIKDRPLVNFENRYVTKSGDIVWLSWTSMPIKTKRVVFAIARDITAKKKIEQYKSISYMLGNTPKQIKLGGQKQHDLGVDQQDIIKLIDHTKQPLTKLSPADQAWFLELETLVRKYTGKIDLTIGALSSEMVISERQLYRRIKNATGITPNRYIRLIRLQMAREAIETGKYRTLAEISYAAGFETPTYFSKLFTEVYGFDVGELL